MGSSLFRPVRRTGRMRTLATPISNVDRASQFVDRGLYGAARQELERALRWIRPSDRVSSLTVLCDLSKTCINAFDHLSGWHYASLANSLLQSSPGTPEALTRRVLYNLTVSSANIGRFQEAKTVGRRLLNLIERGGPDTLMAARTNHALGEVHWEEGNISLSYPMLVMSRDLYGSVGDELGQMLVDLALGSLESRLFRNPDGGMRRLQRASAYLESIGNPWLGVGLENMARVALDQGDTEAADDFLSRGVDFHISNSALTAPYTVGYLLEALALLDRATGHGGEKTAQWASTILRLSGRGSEANRFTTEFLSSSVIARRDPLKSQAAARAWISDTSLLTLIEIQSRSPMLLSHVNHLASQVAGSTVDLQRLARAIVFGAGPGPANTSFVPGAGRSADPSVREAKVLSLIVQYTRRLDGGDAYEEVLRELSTAGSAFDPDMVSNLSLLHAG